MRSVNFQDLPEFLKNSAYYRNIVEITNEEDLDKLYFDIPYILYNIDEDTIYEYLQISDFWSTDEVIYHGIINYIEFESSIRNIIKYLSNLYNKLEYSNAARELINVIMDYVSDYDNLFNLYKLCQLYDVKSINNNKLISLMVNNKYVFYKISWNNLNEDFSKIRNLTCFLDIIYGALYDFGNLELEGENYDKCNDLYPELNLYNNFDHSKSIEILNIIDDLIKKIDLNTLIQYDEFNNKIFVNTTKFPMYDLIQHFILACLRCGDLIIYFYEYPGVISTETILMDILHQKELNYFNFIIGTEEKWNSEEFDENIFNEIRNRSYILTVFCYNNTFYNQLLLKHDWLLIVPEYWEDISENISGYEKAMKYMKYCYLQILKLKSKFGHDDEEENEEEENDDDEEENDEDEENN